jgi:acyl-CoA synthetase (AMP-forming)/AMP-acid ligase II
MSGQLLLTGRSKDTIVLAGGENVEPQPIEDAICCSPIIQHAVVLGQDKRSLGCLVSLDREGFAAYLKVSSLPVCTICCSYDSYYEVYYEVAVNTVLRPVRLLVIAVVASRRSATSLLSLDQASRDASC